MSRLYENDEIREHAEKMVRNNVLLNVSSLICNLHGHENAGDALSIDESEFYDLVQKDVTTYKTTDGKEFFDSDKAEEHASDLTEVESVFEKGIAKNKTSDGSVFVSKEDAELHASDLDAIEEETETFEACEHWVVDRGLAERLEARGEIVQDTCIGHIWGRGASGQGIAMDGVILEIARDALDFLKTA